MSRHYELPLHPEGQQAPREPWQQGAQPLNIIISISFLLMLSHFSPPSGQKLIDKYFASAQISFLAIIKKMNYLK